MKVSQNFHIPGANSKLKRHQLSITLRSPDDAAGVLVDTYVTATGVEECKELVSQLAKHFEEQKES